MILHTLPTRKGKEPATEEQVEEPSAVTDLGPAVVPAGKDGKQGRLHTSMSTIPRLVIDGRLGQRGPGEQVVGELAVVLQALVQRVAYAPGLAQQHLGVGRS